MIYRTSFIAAMVWVTIVLCQANVTHSSEQAANQAASATPSTPGEQPLWQPYRITPRAGAEQHLELNDAWQLSYRDAAIKEVDELKSETEWIPGNVPGTVQMALHRAGKLPHPYYNLNSQKYKWVDEKVWYYRRAFDVPAGSQNQNVFLCFEGIDYYARIWLNGTLLGRHEGMFGGPTIEVSKLIRAGTQNDLVVEVRAANYGNKAGYKPRASGTVIKPWLIAGGTGGEMFFPLGMWRGARIEIVPRQAHLERPFLVTNRATRAEAQLSLSLEVFAGKHSLEYQLHAWDNRQIDNRSNYKEHPLPTPLPRTTSLQLKIEMRERTSGRQVVNENLPLQLNEGRNWVKHELSLRSPKLWQPNGLGQPDLYRVRLALTSGNREVDGLEFDFGVRTIERRPSKGPRTGDRWTDWQFVVNGQPLFIKGVNWMPADILLDLPPERYRWLLGMAKNAGIQLIRVWGGALIETEELYEACNELGIMVWQDFPIGNQDTPQWPQQVWEAQVAQTIFRLRNHPSLAVYCGGNEFNAYSLGNAATVGILERSIATFDPTRFFLRTTPDMGSIHTYPDMDPTWYARIYRDVPYIAETGMHNIPEANSIREVVDARELERPLSEMYTDKFASEHPDFIHHFVEYSPSRVPRMLSRASHIDDMRKPMLESLSEATQIGAGEFYQVLSEGMQANYPVTTGLMPWVYKRPWPVVAIMLVDGFGQPNAPYYFLKRTYEPTHVMVKLSELMWATGENVLINLSVVHAPGSSPGELSASVEILDETFKSRWQQERKITPQPGPSVTSIDLGQFTIPVEFTDKFFFVVAELKGRDGALVSRAVYWPRCLKMMSETSVRDKYRATPQPTLTLERGPWLKPQAAAQPTTLDMKLLSHTDTGGNRGRVQISVRNTGQKPACMTRLNITGTKRAFYATDNFFWLAPGEERRLDVEVLWREPRSRTAATLTVMAWNAPPVSVPLKAAATAKLK